MEVTSDSASPHAGPPTCSDLLSAGRELQSRQQPLPLGTHLKRVPVTSLQTHDTTDLAILSSSFPFYIAQHVLRGDFRCPTIRVHGNKTAGIMLERLEGTEDKVCLSSPHDPTEVFSAIKRSKVGLCRKMIGTGDNHIKRIK